MGLYCVVGSLYLTTEAFGWDAISPFSSVKFGLDVLPWNRVYFLYVLGLNTLEPLHLYPEFGESEICLFMEFWILGDNCF